jgi:hypothetical protein
VRTVPVTARAWPLVLSDREPGSRPHGSGGRSVIRLDCRRRPRRRGRGCPVDARGGVGVASSGLELLNAPLGLAPRALRDIKAGQAADRFTFPNAEIALAAIAGGLLGLLRLHQCDTGHIDEASVDELAEAFLRLLGVPASEATRLARTPLSLIGAW